MTDRQSSLEAVVGGSLAGLMTGIALARQGHTVKQLERAEPSGTAPPLWVTTSNTDGRGSPETGDDKILRLAGQRP